ncbi:hypothetical protein IFM60648_05700 [Aspergillus lentulus]|uniref:Uncharacterized protein n=1 Tax=Aspergillus lentulus TaxID=293939 RepID=A0ABQ1AEM3_ASPLE|nr:hypothetical protein IFM60648_05700 [Aspergillus lentulus]
MTTPSLINQASMIERQDVYSNHHDMEAGRGRVIKNLDAPVLKGFKINGFPDRLPRTFLPDTGEIVGGTL